MSEAWAHHCEKVTFCEIVFLTQGQLYEDTSGHWAV